MAFRQRLQGDRTRLELLASLDELTGLPNRRALEKTLMQQIGSARNGRFRSALVILDIDHFKDVNDHYGHIRGDDCLKRIGRALEGAAARPRDCVARFGGEEFVLVLPETDAESAKKIAERCRKLVRKEQIAHEQSNVAQLVTVSLGVGTIIPEAGDTPLAFIEAVDRLLYQAKQQGRDRLLHGHCGAAKRTPARRNPRGQG